jgi:ribosomal silencing factor RsfS
MEAFSTMLRDGRQREFLLAIVANENFVSTYLNSAHWFLLEAGDILVHILS